MSCYPNSALSSVRLSSVKYLCVIHSNDSMQVIMLDIGDVLYTTQQLNYIVLKHVNGVHINSSSCLFVKEIDYIYSNVDGNH